MKGGIPGNGGKGGGGMPCGKSGTVVELPAPLPLEAAVALAAADEVVEFGDDEGNGGIPGNGGKGGIPGSGGIPGIIGKKGGGIIGIVPVLLLLLLPLLLWIEARKEMAGLLPAI